VRQKNLSGKYLIHTLLKLGVEVAVTKSGNGFNRFRSQRKPLKRLIVCKEGSYITQLKQGVK
jgi:hypothetical protein